MSELADIGVIGLAVMGENLILNMESKGFRVACYNRTVDKVDAFVNGRGAGKNLVGCRTLDQLAANLAKPRKVMLMVRAGDAVDVLIEMLVPLLDPGDIIIDGGNSAYMDTTRRCRELATKGLLHVGAGVSGGEEGALHGPSIMPGGNGAAWPALQPIFQAIAAKVEDGTPCCDWIGPEGSGHFVKTVHNGIEYGDMQIICEAYHLMSQGLGMSAAQMQPIFARWNKGFLDSYLIQITADILSQVDPDSGKPVVDVILDAAGQKGTGKWTSQVGLDLGVAIPQIAEAVFARSLSAAKDERTDAHRKLTGPDPKYTGDSEMLVKQLEQAVYAAKICSYAQGFQLLRAASQEFAWNLNYGGIAQIWREGCIIRARFLGDIKKAYDADASLANLLLAPVFQEVLANAQSAWRNVLKTAMDLGIPMPVMASSLSYYDGYRCARLPANLLQAQRDYFGAHMYERTDRPRGEFFHTNWTGMGGATSSTTYNV
ncbi:6-phosphogluconate dehydrogenase [Desulfonatronum thiosulfatophilum]|uniref:6-phosphogluconate dehydrogenase, decarboxylating n=1 Tax=Desulfonatronum thiosulfatophilum TaxID=617002 RepID=A0A1G6D301_9BACT|nr:decarboxylating NADP(+)-dependent phosphogluconate dehydrogenase [Desulfonatronum thiosulfatophilum]SDB39325.1 6-phosphogluconate dehydrogenase [Desulfonatronum thiosulfatophilum]